MILKRKRQWAAIFAGIALAAILVCMPAALFAEETSEKTNRATITLLEPFSGGNTIEIGTGILTWINYYNSAGVWLYEVAVGICVLWMLIGGIQIMISSDNSSGRQSGITKMKASVIGLLVFIFAGSILQFLNSFFFTSTPT